MATLAQMQAIAAALRVNVSTVQNCVTADDAHDTVKQMLEQQVRAIEALTSSVEMISNVSSVIGSRTGALEQRVNTIEQKHVDGGSRGRKPLSECKCVSNLKILGSDKSEFKSWNEKLVNAMAQSLGIPWRTFMRNLCRKLDQDRKVLTMDEVNEVPGALDITSGDSAAEDLYFVLVEKTEGDAALRVNSGEPGEGLQAYMRVYLWFAGTTGLALTEKTRMLMHPTPVKHEHEIADAPERWAEQERTLRAHGDEYKLSAAFKVTALRVMMSCKREHFEFMEREAKTKHGDKVCDNMFDDLYSRMREYAQQRRLEELTRRQKGDPMDVSQCHTTADWTTTNDWATDGNQQDVDALGKGKGGGKGKKGGSKGGYQKGPCHNCQEMGHHSWECPQPKNKGKGKGQPCFRCGVTGHASWDCTAPYPIQHNKGKGKGKGKVTNEVNQGSEQHWHEQEQGQNSTGPGAGLGGGTVDEVTGGWQVKGRWRGNRRAASGSGQPTRLRGSLGAWPTRVCSNVGNTLKRGIVTHNSFAVLASVDRNVAPQISEVDNIEDGWERIPIKIDSGAIDTVMPPGVARHFATKETEHSKHGPGFRAANGSPIEDFGQKVIKGVSDEYQSLGLTA